jgi:hypothetical protein
VLIPEAVTAAMVKLLNSGFCKYGVGRVMTLLPCLMKIGKVVQSQYWDTAANTDTCNTYQPIRLVFLRGKKLHGFESASELYRSSDRRRSAKLVPTLEDPLVDPHILYIFRRILVSASCFKLKSPRDFVPSDFMTKIWI